MIELAEIEAARARIAGAVVRTPLVRLHVADAPAEIYLKLENLQPINSFKIRGATNAVRQAPAGAWAKGLVTASAGNMAQGVAWTARELGVPATIAAVGYRPVDRGEFELLAGHVDLEEAILSGRVVGPPDDVEAPAGPRPGDPGERPSGLATSGNGCRVSFSKGGSGWKEKSGDRSMKSPRSNQASTRKHSPLWYGSQHSTHASALSRKGLP